MSHRVRSIALLLGAVMLLGTTACAPDNPPGTISKNDLPGDVKVSGVRLDDQAGQVDCGAVNDAEDNHVMTPSENYDHDKRAAIAYELSGPDHQEVSDSVWRLSHPTEAVSQVAAGVAACSRAAPSIYKRFEVPGHPHGLGYIAMEGAPTPTYTRRILIPLSGRVVILSARRQGGSAFQVMPEDLLTKAIEASADAPRG